MTSATTQQICVAAFHSYCRPTTQPITNQQYQIDAVRNEHEQSLIVPPLSKALVVDSMTGLWKEGAGLFQFFPILVEETLDLADTQSKLVKKQVSETLDLSDSGTSIKRIIRQVNETLDLVDAQSKKVFKSISETLSLTDTSNKLVKKTITETLSLNDTTTKLVKRTIAETLALVDTQTKLIKRTIIESLALSDTEQNKAKKTVQEILDLVDNASRIFISGGGTLFQRLVEETLDLADSVSSVFTPAPGAPTTPGTGRYPLPSVKTKPFVRPALVYRHLIRETLDLKDSVQAVAKHYNLIPKMITQTTIRESLSLLDEVTVKVIRTGRKRILRNITGMLEALNDAIALGQDIERVNVGLSATNRKSKELGLALEHDISKVLKRIERDVKNNDYLGMEQIKINYQEEIRALIRMSVQKSFQLAINYVGKAIKEPSLFFSETDIRNIKLETERIENIFWRNTFTFIQDLRTQKRLAEMPIGIAGFFETILGIAKVIGEIASFGTVTKATTSKLSQIPAQAINDPITNVATIPKRVLVFVTKKDGKVCPICSRYEGVEYEEDDPFIVRPIDDTHPNCRCRLLIKGTDEDIITG